jgi:hypothetical protein
MNNKIRKFFFGGDSKVTVLLILSLFIFVGLACKGRSGDAKPIPAAYLGEWEGQDGTQLSIRADGKGDYRSGGTKVEGGTAEVDEAAKTVSVTFFGIGKTLKIDEPPAGDRMKLDGINFRRKGGFSSSDTASPKTNDSTSGNTPFSKNSDSSDSAPTNSEVDSLVKQTMADFTDAVEREDFTDFHSNGAEAFQSAYTPEQVKTAFQIFIDKKNTFLPSLNSVDETTANFSSPPRVSSQNNVELLTAEGFFPTRPAKVQFTAEYIKEGGSWKMLKFRVRL